MGSVENNAPHCSFCEGTRGMLDKYWNDVKVWAKKPYDENGDVLDWVLFLGLITVATFLWTRVIRAILSE